MMLHGRMPDIEVWFDLEVECDQNILDTIFSQRYNPSRMPRSSEGCKYLGPELTGKHRYRAKLAHLGDDIRSLEEARHRAKEIGCRLVEGQALGAFVAMFPKPAGIGPIVFGGSEWRSPNGKTVIAYLFVYKGEWSPDLDESDTDFYLSRRWLVAEEPV